MKYYIIKFKFFSFILLGSLLFSCLKSQKEDNGISIGTKLIIPEVKSNSKKIVIRFIGDCSSCLASINNLKEFCDFVKIRNRDVKIVFYVEILSEEKFRDIKQKLDFADNVIFDPKRDFYRRNLLKFPYGLDYHLFLLNEENEILHLDNLLIKKELIEKYIEKL